jgi:hypothetical protein
MTEDRWQMTEVKRPTTDAEITVKLTTLVKQLTRFNRAGGKTQKCSGKNYDWILF